MKTNWSTLIAALALSAAIPASGAEAQAYPARPIHVVVGLPAGGGADAIARFVAAALADSLGQPVIVENRPGSNTLIAAEAVAKSAPDGYTLLFGGVTSAVLMPILGVGLSFDPVKDFAPVSVVASVPLVLVVGTETSVRTVGDLLAFAKTHPGQTNYASSGTGSALHLSMEMLKSRTGFDAVHIPYKGGVQAVPDLLSGRIHAMFEILPTQVANIQSGKVRALAVTSRQRNSQIPDVPTMAEAGLPDFEAAIWYTVAAPARTPMAIVDKLNAELRKALQSPELRERIALLGAEAAPSTPADVSRLQKAEAEKWAKVIRAAGVRLD